ncbi:CopD family protein [Thermomicrobium sp. 4228-Ro]|uniref:DUF4149 domain-containing protein n=1 Tax=Thermomicrobium sp. 4228-Ro TaxID=2993937 RepID=UPI0022491280|nr:DUF4149 domain-containing protein [Thermomicrobium sp. 4228-Ro]MCX2726387.1 CopD family protein [Thermomicrobium sp. 4228-Ro]
MSEWLWATIRWLHLVALSFWLGGQLFLVLVVQPVLRLTVPDRAQRLALTATLGRRYSPLAWVSLGIMIVTGLLLGTHRGVQWTALLSWNPGYGRTLAIKMLLVGIVLVLTVLHGRLIGPRLAVAARAPHNPHDRGYRQLARWSRVVSSLNLMLTLVIVLLAARLVP